MRMIFLSENHQWEIKWNSFVDIWCGFWIVPQTLQFNWIPFFMLGKVFLHPLAESSFGRKLFNYFAIKFAFSRCYSLICAAFEDSLNYFRRKTFKSSVNFHIPSSIVSTNIFQFKFFNLQQNFFGIKKKAKPTVRVSSSGPKLFVNPERRSFHKVTQLEKSYPHPQSPTDNWGNFRRNNLLLEQ